jgi:cytochrome o ubiquinol oxidase operon protein cyoD
MQATAFPIPHLQFPAWFGLSARVPDFVALMKRRAMLQAVFTSAAGLFIAPRDDAPLLGIIPMFGIAGGAGVSGVLSMWYGATYAERPAFAIRSFYGSIWFTVGRPDMRPTLRIGGLIAFVMLSGRSEGVLDPKGPISAAERLILFNSLGIMLAARHRLGVAVHGHLSDGSPSMTEQRFDRAPGDRPAAFEAEGHTLSDVEIQTPGLALAVVLTATSFWVANTSLLWAPGVLLGVAVLAVAQMDAHLVFFTHITTGPDSTNNVLPLALGVLIVIRVAGGSIFIIPNLSQNMIPSSKLMNLHSQH